MTLTTAQQFEYDRFMRLPRFFVGLDLGKARDYTALAVVRRLPVRVGGVLLARHEVVGLDRYRGKPYPTIVREVAALMNRPELWRHPDLGNQEPPVLAVDGTGVGSPVVDMFLAAGMACDILPVVITGGESARERFQDGCRRAWVPKRDLASGVQLAMQEGRFAVANGPHADTLRAELDNFSVRTTASGHNQFGAGADWRDGNHDDLTLAVTMAVWAGERPEGPSARVVGVNMVGPGAPVNGQWGTLPADYP